MMPPITYHSTRNHAEIHSFEDILLAGLAPDGGLYVPSHLPHFTPVELLEMARLPYAELAYSIIAPFVGEALTAEHIRSIIEESYATFAHPVVTPLVQLEHNHFILELFHGETLAFKDVALQFLGRVMDATLQKQRTRLTILGATSGDTGSAAIAGCRGRDTMDVVILYPHGRVSDVQRRQMTTVQDTNIHCLAIQGTFDDCQHIVKTLFVDTDLRAQKPLGAVNSINWTRIVAQIVYYFYAAFQLGVPARAVSFSVPTGNFGDIYAGYLARQMGLPIEKLIIATNKNDILARALATGEYRTQSVEKTYSPSMDIGISSNFERLLYDLYAGDSAHIAQMMQTLKDTHAFTLAPEALRRLRRDFAAVRCDDEATIEVMQRIYRQCNYTLDPHTATGVYATHHVQQSHTDTTYVTLATAHPAKFPDVVERATGVSPALPAHLHDLYTRKERFTVLPNDANAVRNYILTL
jgi:threonine synthase